jgi:uncharacterized protein YdaU (DUF1376 family)
MSLPYFPMFPTDFEAKTSHLTMIEDGAYNRLLRICWMTPGCSMPNDEAWIMRRARAQNDIEKDAVRNVLIEFFTVENGRYSNARLHKEWLAANEAHERRKSAGSKGGLAKPKKAKVKTPSNAVAKPKQPEPEPEPYIIGDTNVSPAISPASEAVQVYNEVATNVGWPVVQKMTKPRISAINARLAECGGVDGWRVAIEKASASDFLTGRTSRPFFASFDWITAHRNFTKIMEGNYDNRSGKDGAASMAGDTTLDIIAAAARSR